MNCKNVVPSSPRLVGDQRNGGEMNCKMLCDVRRLSSSPRLVGDQPSAPLLVDVATAAHSQATLVTRLLQRLARCREG